MLFDFDDPNNSGYKKYKYIVNDFLSHMYLSPKHYENNCLISKDSAEKIFTRLKKAQIIYKNTKETNKLNDDLINSFYFNDKNLNTVLIASVVSRENSEVASQAIQYIFKDIPFRIYDCIAKQFANTLQEDFFKYIDMKKYQYLQFLINGNYGVYYECEIESPELASIQERIFNKSTLAIPLELFFFQSKMYVYFYIPKTKKYKIIDASSIKSIKIIKESYFQPQTKDVINTNINTFIFGDSKKENSITVWIPAILLGVIYESGLIERFEIKDQADMYTSFYSSPIYIDIKEKPTIQKEYEDTNKEIFDQDLIDQKLKVKIYANQINLILFVKLHLDQIELVEYKCIKKFIKPFLKKINSERFVLISWIFIAFMIGFWINK